MEMAAYLLIKQINPLFLCEKKIQFEWLANWLTLLSFTKTGIDENFLSNDVCEHTAFPTSKSSRSCSLLIVRGMSSLWHQLTLFLACIAKQVLFGRLFLPHWNDLDLATLISIATITTWHHSVKLCLFQVKDTGRILHRHHNRFFYHFTWHLQGICMTANG